MPSVPKVAHFYWGESWLPYLRYLTLETFHAQNPDWQMKLYVPQYPTAHKTWTTHEQQFKTMGADFFPELSKLPVETIVIDCAGFEISNTISEVHKSDLFRWNLLATEGGLWSDMDVLYFKPIPLLRHQTGVCINPRYGHSIGFLFSSPGNPVFSAISHYAKQEFDPAGYQSAGVSVLNRHFPTTAHMSRMFPGISILDVPMAWVYAHDAVDITKIYEEGGTDLFTEQSIGIHWYAGHPMAGDHVNKVTPHNVHTFNNVFGRALSRSMKGNAK